MEVYSFSLYDINENSSKCVMGTELDEPNPMVDAEFWNRFMQGDVVMHYEGKHIEEVE
jgi:hypothetical protein